MIKSKNLPRRLCLDQVSRTILEQKGWVWFVCQVKPSVFKVDEELLLSETYEELGMDDMRGTLGWSNRRRVSREHLRKRCVVEDMRLVRVNELSDEDWHELGIFWGDGLKWYEVNRYLRESLHCAIDENMRLWLIKVRRICSE